MNVCAKRVSSYVVQELIQTLSFPPTHPRTSRRKNSPQLAVLAAQARERWVGRWEGRLTYLSKEEFAPAGSVGCPGKGKIAVGEVLKVGGCGFSFRSETDGVPCLIG